MTWAVTLQQMLFLAILAGVVILLFTEWLRIDLVAILIIVVLAASGLLLPEEALAGFGSEPAILLAAIFVLSGALHHTGFSARLGTWIGRLAGKSYPRMIAVIMPSVALLSAFTHHVTLTAVMLPIALKISRDHGVPASRLLMPISFAASLGTTITIVGAPAFLLADGLLRQAGRQGLGIFSIAPIGLALSLLGTLFVLLLGRFLLPDRPAGAEAAGRYRLEAYYTELVLQSGSPYINKTIEEIQSREEEDFKIVNWLRQGRPQRRPYASRPTEEGDVLLVRTTPEKIATLQKDPSLALHPLVKYGENASSPNANKEDQDPTSRLVQAVVAPGSELIYSTIGKIDFLQRYGVVVIGVWRQKGWLQTELSKIRLREGDVLVLTGEEEALERVAKDPAFLLLLPFQGEPKPRRKAALAVSLLVASILLTVFNLLPVEIALLAGAAGVVLTGCLTPRQAYQSIDVRIYVFIAGAIPLGRALEKTGTAELLAGWFQGVAAHWSLLAVLLVLFAVAALLTQVMSDAATVALLAPVALALAHLRNAAPEPFVVTVAMAAVASFLTPIGHHGNLLIYGPGRYRFVDFVYVGAPLTVLIGLLVAWLAPLLWPS